MGKKKQIRELQEIVDGLGLSLRKTNETVNQMGVDLHLLFSTVSKIELNGFSSDLGKRITDLQRILLLMPWFKEAMKADSAKVPPLAQAAWKKQEAPNGQA